MNMAVEPRSSFDDIVSPTASKGRLRSLSDNSPALVPSPDIRESSAVSQDDSSPTLFSNALTPRRHDLVGKPLSLQTPGAPRETPAKPLSISLQQQQSREPIGNYTSHATSLPRHSRGLDFSRACTNLHHSTLAESSPDSSPICYQRNGSTSLARALGEHAAHHNALAGSGGSVWASYSNNHHDAGPRGNSAASTLVHASPIDSESDDDDSMGDHEDSIYSTPQVHRLNNPSVHTTPYGSTSAASGSTMSPNAASLMKSFQRTRLRRESSNKGSIFNNGPLFSPKRLSPFALHSIETSSTPNGYFASSGTQAASKQDAMTSVAPDQIHADVSSEAPGSEAASDSAAVMRKVVTQRKNLLPKTKGFARIKAALQEECAPVDTEVRREAETIRQVREHNNDGFDAHRPSATSPTLLPTATSGSESNLEDNLDDSAMSFDLHSADHQRKPPRSSFSLHASKNSGGVDFWTRFDDNFRTPPPPGLSAQSSADMTMHNPDSPVTADASSSSNNNGPHASVGRSESIWSTSTVTEESAATSAPPSSATIFSPPSSTSVPSTTTELPSAQTPWARKFNGKRSRATYTDSGLDDLDIMSIKRRAVSPSLSVQNSPVAAASAAAAAAAAAATATGGTAMHSPQSRRGSLGWKGKSEGIPSLGLPGPMLGSNGSAVGGNGTQAGAMPGGAPGKRIGLQGMTDTSDGFMKMSIE